MRLLMKNCSKIQNLGDVCIENQFLVDCNSLSDVFVSCKQTKMRECEDGKLENLMRSRVSCSENCFSDSSVIHHFPNSLHTHSSYPLNASRQPFRNVFTVECSPPSTIRHEFRFKLSNKFKVLTPATAENGSG